MMRTLVILVLVGCGTAPLRSSTLPVTVVEVAPPEYKPQAPEPERHRCDVDPGPQPESQPAPD